MDNFNFSFLPNEEEQTKSNTSFTKQKSAHVESHFATSELVDSLSVSSSG